jgi:hypothetical protein
MQDWEWEIADSARINDYICLYMKSHMNDDDRITLMETIIQSTEDLYSLNGFPPKQWRQVKLLLTANSKIHHYTIFYWSNLDGFTPFYDCWSISKEMNRLYFKLYKNANKQFQATASGVA